MDVGVNAAREDDTIRRIDLLLDVLEAFGESHDPPIFDADVASSVIGGGHNSSVADDHVEAVHDDLQRRTSLNWSCAPEFRGLTGTSFPTP